MLPNFFQNYFCYEVESHHTKLNTMTHFQKAHAIAKIGHFLFLVFGEFDYNKNFPYIVRAFNSMFYKSLLHKRMSQAAQPRTDLVDVLLYKDLHALIMYANLSVVVENEHFVVRLKINRYDTIEMKVKHTDEGFMVYNFDNFFEQYYEAMNIHQASINLKNLKAMHDEYGESWPAEELIKHIMLPFKMKLFVYVRKHEFTMVDELNANCKIVKIPPIETLLSRIKAIKNAVTVCHKVLVRKRIEQAMKIAIRQTLHDNYE